MPARSPSAHLTGTSAQWSTLHRHTHSVCGFALRSRTGAVVLFCRRLFTRLGVFAQLQEENGRRRGRGGGPWRCVCVCVGVYAAVGRLILFAFGTQTVQSMQIDKQWPFAVLFLSCNISVFAQESTQKGSRWPSPLCARPRRPPTPARCVRRFKSGPRKGPRPRATNHMKVAASLQIALPKGIFDV